MRGIDGPLYGDRLLAVSWEGKTVMMSTIDIVSVVNGWIRLGRSGLDGWMAEKTVRANADPSDNRRDELQPRRPWRDDAKTQGHIVGEMKDTDVSRLADVAVSSVQVNFCRFASALAEDAVEAALQVGRANRMSHQKCDRLVNGQIEVRTNREPEVGSLLLGKKIDLQPKVDGTYGAGRRNEASERK